MWTLAGGFAAAVVAVALIQVVLEPVLLLAFGDEALPALGSARILVVAGLFLGMRRLSTALLQGLGRPGTATAAEALGFVAMVIAMLSLVPSYGLHGACAAMLIAGVVTAVAGLIGLERHTRRSGPTVSASRSETT